MVSGRSFQRSNVHLSFCVLADHWTQTIHGSLHQRFSLRLNSLKLVIDSIRFDHLLLLLDEFQSLRALWLILNHHEYLDADKWQHLFESSLTQLDRLDLTIALTKPFLSLHPSGQFLMLLTPHIACSKFNGKFWFDRGWHPKLDEYDHCVRLTVANTSLSN